MYLQFRASCLGWIQDVDNDTDLFRVTVVLYTIYPLSNRNCHLMPRVTLYNRWQTTKTCLTSEYIVLGLILQPLSGFKELSITDNICQLLSLS